MVRAVGLDHANSDTMATKVGSNRLDLLDRQLIMMFPLGEPLVPDPARLLSGLAIPGASRSDRTHPSAGPASRQSCSAAKAHITFEMSPK